ncbi:SAM-dependent methyltransferase [Mycobacteroides chelonae]|nr:SAM-dependent methyltransferase [Mycobacteroides chelonae]
MAEKQTLPLAGRRDEDLPGHWLLARLGKRVLRPGGLELTTRLLAAGRVTDADVVELGPGLGRTARDIVALRPRSYVGVDDTAAATQSVRDVVAPCGGRVIIADAASTGLPDASADVVVGEAMLTMQSDKAKRAIVDEAYRLLRPGGRYAIHELGLTPDSVGTETTDDIRRALAHSIKVNARPLTVAEWSELLRGSGFKVVSTDRAPMALLKPRRVIADEGILGAFRLVKNVLLHGGARKRVLAMRRTFNQHKGALTAVALVGVRPE